MLLPILLSLITVSAHAGRTKDFQCGNAYSCVIPYDSEGNQNGTESCYTDDSKSILVREVSWKNGKREGVARCFKEKKLSVEAIFKNDALNGPFLEIDYDASGDRVTLMENGEEVGLSFSLKGGRVSSVNYCLVGGTPEFDAVFSCADRDYGKYNTLLATWKKEELQKNKIAAAKEAKRRNGPQESKYPSGKIRSKWTTLDGEIHGKFLGYTEAGKVKTDCEYKNGNLEGVCLAYDDEGRLDKKETWKNRKLIKEERFYDNGNPERVSTQEGDKKFCHTDFYENGKKMTAWCTTERNVWSWYGQQEGSYTQWDYDGSISVKGNFKNGLRVGLWEYFDGKDIRSELTYEKGNLMKSVDYERKPPQHRIVREYFPDGSLKNETRFEGLEGNQKQLI